MEPGATNKQVFQATDITMHGRDFRPSQKFENSLKRAPDGTILSGRVYGIPRLVVDPDTGLVYLGHQFSREITEKFLDGTIEMPKDISIVIDEETQNRMKEKDKRKLKNSTRVWHK